MSSTATERRPRYRFVAYAATAVLALLVAAEAVFLFRPVPQHARTAVADNSVSPIGGPFELTTQSGAKLSDKDLLGQPFLVFFGFTRCPEICPTTLWEMTEAMKTLGPQADRFKVVFISVDPTRDTPAFLDKYLQSFDHRIIGLTGTEDQIASVGKEYHAYWEKVPTEGGDYTMNHTATIFLMDAKGHFQGTISYGEEMKTRLEKLRRLIGSSA